MSDENQGRDEFPMDIGDIQSKMSEVDDFHERPTGSEPSDIRSQLKGDSDTSSGLGEALNEHREQASLSINNEALISLLSDVGTGLWRMQKTMIDRETGLPNDEMRRPYRHLSALLDSLQERGIEIRDHTGERVPDSGIYGLKVITYEPKEELQNEVVTETVKPTIILGNKIVQMGEVIVGIPKASEEIDEEE